MHFKWKHSLARNLTSTFSVSLIYVKYVNSDSSFQDIIPIHALSVPRDVVIIWRSRRCSSLATQVDGLPGSRLRSAAVDDCTRLAAAGKRKLTCFGGIMVLSWDRPLSYEKSKGLRADLFHCAQPTKGHSFQPRHCGSKMRHCVDMKSGIKE